MSKVILFQGDSITDAGRSRENDTFLGAGYPLLIQAKLGVEAPETYRFINRGISGNRIVDLYARIKIDFINVRPDYLSILIGVNDVWHDLGGTCNGVDAKKYERMYDQLLIELKEALPLCNMMLIEPFVLEGTATCNTDTEKDRWDHFRDEVRLRAEATNRLAKKHGFPCLALQPIFDEACKKAEASYWLSDGVHPTPMGHELIAQEWLKIFENM